MDNRYNPTPTFNGRPLNPAWNTPGVLNNTLYNGSIYSFPSGYTRIVPTQGFWQAYATSNTPEPYFSPGPWAIPASHGKIKPDFPQQKKDRFRDMKG